MKKEEKAQKINELIEKLRITIVSEKNLKELKADTMNIANKSLRRAILKRLGIDSNWSDWEIKSDSEISKIVIKQVDDYFKSLDLTLPILTDAEKLKLQKAYEKAYKYRLLRKVEDYASLKADEDLELFDFEGEMK